MMMIIVVIMIDDAYSHDDNFSDFVFDDDYESDTVNVVLNDDDR